MYSFYVWLLLLNICLWESSTFLCVAVVPLFSFKLEIDYLQAAFSLTFKKAEDVFYLRLESRMFINVHSLLAQWFVGQPESVGFM